MSHPRLSLLLIFLAACGAQLVGRRGQSQYGPMNEKRGGEIKYLREGARAVIEGRRENAYQQMFNECDGRYLITREWDESDGPTTNGVAKTRGNTTAWSSTTYSSTYHFIAFECVTEPSIVETLAEMPAPVRARYDDAAEYLTQKQYAAANDLLNGLATDFPRVPDIYRLRCSAQLGMKHWAAAESDCKYSRTLKDSALALYGLAVAEDGLGRAADAVAHYREYVAHPQSSLDLRRQASDRIAVLVQPAPEVPPVASPTSEERHE